MKMKEKKMQKNESCRSPVHNEHVSHKLKTEWNNLLVDKFGKLFVFRFPFCFMKIYPHEKRKLIN